VPIDRFPLFVRKGAILPMDLREGGLFDESTETPAPLTVLVIPDLTTPSAFDVYEEGGTGFRIELTRELADLILTVSATERTVAFRVRNPGIITRVIGQPAELAETESLAALAEAGIGWFFDEAANELWIHPGDASRGAVVRIQ
jgi:hypothetical protein